MRRLLLNSTAVLLLSGGGVMAGGMAEPVMEPAVVEAQTASSAGGMVIPLLLLVLIAAAAASSGGGESLPSDRRLKTDITRVGTTHLGLPLYRYRYVGLPAVYEGVMAQDVAILHPGAVTRLPYGYMAVDYGKLGLQMRQVH